MLAVHRDEPIHLGRESDRGDRPPVDPASGEELGDHVAEGPRPVVRILFCPARVRVGDWIALCRFRNDTPGIVEQDALEALGTDVTPDNVDGRTSSKSSVVR